jgi:4-amino-4-deoxy-L-arabinose transferase-like glycosyltransferase
MLSAMSVVLGFLIGKELFGDKPAILIAFVLLLNPNQLNYVREIMSEVPAEFFLMAGLYVLLKHRYFISSIFLIITCYIRTEFIPVIFILGLILLIKDRKPVSFYRFAAGVIFMLLIIATARYDGIVKSPNNLGENLLFAINKNSHEGLDFSTSRYTQEQVAHPITTYLNFAEQHSSQYLSQRFWSLWELWGPWPGDGNNPRARRGVLAKCVIGSRFIFLLLALFAAYHYRNRWETYILLTPVFVITAVHFVFYSTPRYEYVVEPLVIILAIGEAKTIYKTIRKHLKCHPEFSRLAREKEDLAASGNARCR